MLSPRSKTSAGYSISLLEFETLMIVTKAFISLHRIHNARILKKVLDGNLTSSIGVRSSAPEGGLSEKDNAF